MLFARFDNTNAYLIDVLPHGVWSLQRLVKELHDNWPVSVKHFRVNGILGHDTTVSDEDIANLRKCNANTMVDLGNDVVYAPIGGGYVASGLSADVVIHSDRCAMRLRQMQQQIIENIGAIAKEAKEQGVSFPDCPCFELQINNGDFFAVEVNCMVTVPLGEL